MRPDFQTWVFHVLGSGEVTCFVWGALRASCCFERLLVNLHNGVDNTGSMLTASSEHQKPISTRL